jgi:Ankyrin repeats (3 copies)
LKRCLTVHDLKKQLETLPRTLDETYDQIFLRIDEAHRENALRILQWLSFAARPVSVQEAAEVLAVDIGDHPHYNVDRKLLDPLDVLLLCSTLVTKVQYSTLSSSEIMPIYSSYDFNYPDGTWVIRLAHLSVKDYLLSDKIKSGKASFFATDRKLANITVAQTCITYLLHSAFAIGYSDRTALRNRSKEWPLYHYAVNFWPHHIIYSGNDLDEKTWLLLQRFFRTRESGIGGNYAAWVSALAPNIAVKDLLATQPLYFAASFGITSLITKLLETDPHLEIDAPGGRGASSPLLVATFRNHAAAVKLLLEANANPMSRDRAGRSCLFWATFGGLDEVLKLLQTFGATLTESDKKKLDIMQGMKNRTGHHISTAH